MAVTIEDVRAIAGLARLQFDDAEQERLVAELNRILQYMEKLSELDTSDVPPTSHVVPITNAFRDDGVCDFDRSEDLVASAPRPEEGYFAVPRVID